MSKVVITNLNENTPRYPAAYQMIDKTSDGFGIVVLFFSRELGAVVQDATPARYMRGYVSNNWISCTNERVWKPVNLSIEH